MQRRSSMKWRKTKIDLLLAGSNHLHEKLVGYLVIMLLARHLDKPVMGELFFAAALTYFVGLFTDLGTGQYLIRRIAEDASRATDHLAAVLSLRLPLAALVFAGLNGAVYLISPDLAVTFLLTSIFVLLQDLYYSFSALFLGLRRVGYRVLTGISAQLLLALLIVGAVALDGGLPAVLACYVAANAVLIGFAAVLVWVKIGHFRLIWDPAGAREIVRLSMPFFVVTMLGVVHFKADTMMLGMMYSLDAVASYEAAYKLLEVSRFVIRPMAMIFFPICAGLVARRAWREFDAILGKLIVATGLLGVAGAVVVIAGADLIIPLIFGPQFGTSVPILRVLFLAAPFVFIGFAGSFLAAALHLEKTTVKIVATAVVANIALNLFAIPQWGGLGAAWTTLATQALLAVWLLGLILRHSLARRAPAAAGPAETEAADWAAEDSTGI